MERDYLILNNSTGIKRIYFDQLMYVKIEGYALTCFLEGDETFSCMKSLKDLMPALPSTFIRLSRNYTINAKKIIFFNPVKRLLTMQDGHEIQIPIRKMKQIRVAFTDNKRQI